MAYARARKHYRAVRAKHEADAAGGYGVLIPREKRPFFIAILSLASALIFVKGIFIGMHIAGRGEE